MIKFMMTKERLERVLRKSNLLADFESVDSIELVEGADSAFYVVVADCDLDGEPS